MFWSPRLDRPKAKSIAVAIFSLIAGKSTTLKEANSYFDMASLSALSWFYLNRMWTGYDRRAGKERGAILSNLSNGSIGEVVAICRYPVKSMMGEDLNATEVTD